MDSQVKRKLTPIKLTDTVIDDSFWTPRIRVNREQTIPHEYSECKRTGRVDGYDPNWQPKSKDEFRHVFNDSDLSKWLEAASYSLATHPDPELEALCDSVIDLMATAQAPDGYLNSYYQNCEPDKRWTNLRDKHELYCAGHMFEAAVAYSEATGKRSLLDVACKYADHIDSVFGPEPGKKRGYCGHEEIELALVKLYRATGNDRYLKLAKYFIDERGRQPHYYDFEAIARGEDPKTFWAKTYAYMQADKPVREQTEAAGHAVRATYLFSAMADLAGELGDDALLGACERLWENLCNRQMYVTGGIGPSASNEGFTSDYDLPNEKAYAETCAAIGLVFWAHRLLQLDCDSRYADVMERALYNGVLSGVSLDGKQFFYGNPLASTGGYHRSEWFGCACCPPNIARLLASLGAYVYSRSETDAVVHLYVQGSGKFNLGGRELAITQETNYPWDGRVKLTVSTGNPGRFGIKFRVPGWSRGVNVKVNGQPFDESGSVEKGYIRIERQWADGDKVEIELPMPVELVSANPNVRQDAGKAAIQRGPVVYCLEAVDNPTGPFKTALPRDPELAPRFEKDLLGGVVAISGDAFAYDDSDWEGTLYRQKPPRTHKTKLTAIPYYAWANRGDGEMLIWVEMFG